jgi:16S rRNA (adenine1518-N6/adenine1519-N6)-dimethyltransferase
VQTLAEIREMLEVRGLSPRHRFGQNFLIDHNLIRRLVDASGVREGDAVMEIGPGTGTMTEELLARGCRVVACELDAGLAALVRERFAAQASEGRFTLVEGDCMDGKRALNPALVEAIDHAARANSAGGGSFTLVSNLPYGAATPALSTLMINHPGCRGMYVTVQKELGDRLRAGPGSEDYGVVSLVAWACAEVRVLATLPAECFWPRPDVTSVMLEVERRATIRSGDPRGLAGVAQALLAQRRKQVGRALRGLGVEPEKVGVEASARAEDLAPEVFERIRGEVARGPTPDIR